jgi:tetratricopeptide (TPR) repeat protein
MRSIKAVFLVSLAGIAALSIAGVPVCFGQDADAQKDIQKAQEFYRAGQKYMLEGDFAAANEEFMKAEIVLRTSSELPSPAAPRDIPALPVRGQEPAAAPSRALDPDIYYNLGVGALQKGDFIQAEAAFLRVIELTPLDKEACYNLGVLYEKYIGKPAEALKFYTRYINLSGEGDRDIEQVKGWIKDLKERARQ